MRKIRKAIIALIVPAIVGGANTLGITEGMPFVEAVTVLVTAGAVYLIPNET